MGRYLNVDLKGEMINLRSKCLALINSGAEVLEKAPDKFDQFPDKGIICVVDNGFFQAAAFAYSQSELDEFKVDDGRPKAWLLADSKLLEEYAK